MSAVITDDFIAHFSLYPYFFWTFEANNFEQLLHESWAILCVTQLDPWQVISFEKFSTKSAFLNFSPLTTSWRLALATLDKKVKSEVRGVTDCVIVSYTSWLVVGGDQWHMRPTRTDPPHSKPSKESPPWWMLLWSVQLWGLSDDRALKNQSFCLYLWTWL